MFVFLFLSLGDLPLTRGDTGDSFVSFVRSFEFFCLGETGISITSSSSSLLKQKENFSK